MTLLVIGAHGSGVPVVGLLVRSCGDRVSANSPAVPFAFHGAAPASSVGDADQVVGGGREGEDGVGLCASADLHLFISRPIVLIQPKTSSMRLRMRWLIGVAGMARACARRSRSCALAGLAERR